MIRHLSGFFPEFEAIVARPPCTVVLVCGHDPSAQAKARRLGVPLIPIEDGFVRSIGPAQSGAPTVSLLVGGEARVIDLLQNPGWETPALMAQAASLMAFKRAERLGRLNTGPVIDLDGPRILVVGDTDGTMAQAARRDHPDGQIVALAPQDGAAADVVALVEQADAVYTDDDLIGLEAILCGRPVTCFGQPFYAGWGLTTDAAPLPGRTRRRTSQELFAAAYLVASRYIDPLTGEACSPELAFERLAAFKRHARRVAGRWVGLNIPPVKRGAMRDFLEGPCSSFSRDAPGARRVAWASRPNRAVREARSRHPDRIVNIEDGFIRSAGLGAAFKPASSIVLDERGIYYDPGSSSNLEHMLLTASFDPPLLARAKALRRRIVALRLSKYNLRAADFQAPAGRRVILVPGQVENDASVLAGGCGLSNTDLIERVRRDNPDAFVVYKPHPDVVAGYRPGAVVAARLRGLVDRTVEDADVLACIDAAHEVHTLTSLTGFEALLRGKTVVAYGWPFYAGWGLTRDEGPAPAPRRRLLTLDELVAATLILYPLYLDPVSRLPCDVETFLKRLSEQAHVPAPRGHGRYLSAVRQMLTPSRRQPY